jgi:hypothetical protein
MLTAVPDQLSAESRSIAAGPYPCWWPWSYRIAGPASRWPAVEVYEAGRLLDVVTCTRLAAQLLRGGRAVRTADDERAFAWGRLPLSGGTLSVEFSRGLVRKARLIVPVIEVTSWCWFAGADESYDTVTVRCGEVGIRSRLRAGRP